MYPGRYRQGVPGVPQEAVEASQMAGQSTGMSQPHMQEIPPIGDLSEQQIRGAACVHCGIHLDNATAVDLGERRTRRAGVLVRWFPRACPRHGGRL